MEGPLPLLQHQMRPTIDGDAWNLQTFLLVNRIKSTIFWVKQDCHLLFGLLHCWEMPTTIPESVPCTIDPAVLLTRLPS